MRMKSIIKFFSSVKLAIGLLIALALASVLGTLIPQGRTVEEYAARYGQLSGFFTRLQLTHLYHSVWYLTLLGFFALNIVVCTLTRLDPKFRRAFHPRVQAEAKNLLVLKIKDRLKKNAPLPEAKAELVKALRGARYRVRESSAAGRAILLARKKIWGIFGSDFVHAGLLVIIAGGIVSGLAGFRTELKLHEGEVQTVPRADFSIRLDKFTTLYYDEDPGLNPEQRQVKSWISAVTVLENGREVRTHNIEVNHPLRYKGSNFYQSSYGFDPAPAATVDLAFELKTFEGGRLEIWAKKKSVPSYLKKLSLKAGERTILDETEGLSIIAIRYLPDFVLGEGNKPETRSAQPNNPAAFIEAYRGEDQIVSGWVFANFPDFTQMHASSSAGGGQPFSVIEAARDPGTWLIWAGCVLIMAGLGLAFYWPTWEIKAVLEEAQSKTELVAGGLATKSREAFTAEFEKLMASLRRPK